MPISADALKDLVAPERTALVLQEVQNGVVGEQSVLPQLAAVAQSIDLVGHCARIAQRARDIGVPAAVPIGLDGDTVIFGVPKSQLVAVQTPFRNNADEIRSELAKHLGRRMMFKLAEHDFDAPGALQPRVNATVPAETPAPTPTATPVVATPSPSPSPAPASKPKTAPAPKAASKPMPAAASHAADAPPPEEPPDDFEVDLSDLIDARDAPPLRDTAELFMSELGAQVVEERPFGQ
jgi:outer membrane biosynthesis protein TonB